MRCSVLIVIRHQENMEQMSVILASRGYQITDTCTSGAQALRCAANRPCDIAIVGFSLPDMTGLDFAEDLQGICNASVLLIVPPEQMSYARKSVGDLDVSCLARPIITEADAWRQMQKQSMDTGKPLEHVARHILDIYGTG